MARVQITWRKSAIGYRQSQKDTANRYYDSKFDEGEAPIGFFVGSF